MGRRGPAPTPTEVKLRQGETRPSRINRLEPRPRHAAPVMPKGMDPEARKVWRQVLRDMRGTGIIFAVDAYVLRCFCDAVARYAQAAEPYAASGPLVMGRERELVRNPLFQVTRDHAAQILLFSRELGLSPSARAGLRVEPSAVSGDIEDVLGPPPRLRVVGGGDE
jgi:P27 family predicted phage terminase small subunit